MLTYELPSVNGFYPIITCHFNIVYRAIQQTFKSFLLTNRLKQNRIPYRIVAGWISVHIIQNSSSKMPVSRRFEPPAPISHIRISEEQLPPRTGLSWTNTTRLPLLARKSRRTFLRVILRQRIYQLYEELLVFYFSYTITTFL